MKEQLILKLVTSRNYTLSVAEAMQESDFAFRPAEGVWTFAELLDHVAYGIHWWKENYICGNEIEWAPVAAAESKSTVIANLNAAYDALGQLVDSLKPDTNQVLGFYATLDHVTHHRGQAVIYLRCCGITPPEYVH